MRAKANRRQTRSDWMGIERERGISVVTSVMTFEYGDCVFNLLDTPGHEDFSEDTYRTLTAVDSAVMVIDAAKGIEARTRKLFEVCRLRDIPIVTFVNKLDREARDPFELLDEIEKTLALDTAPMTWPIGSGRDFKGTYDLRHNRVRRFGTDDPPIAVNGPQRSALRRDRRRDALARSAAEEIELARDGCKPFDLDGLPRRPSDAGLFRQRAAHVRRRRSDRRAGGIRAAAAAHRGGIAHRRSARAEDDGLRVQDPGEHGPEPPRPHRLLARVVRATAARHEGEAAAHRQEHGDQRAAVLLRAGARASPTRRCAGDVVGIPNHGTLRIGDTLSEGEDLVFRGVPSFAPEILRRVRIGDAMRAKKLREALQQMAEEGVVQVFVPEDGGGVLVGVVGALQLDVLAERLKAEYGLEVTFETSRFETCRWVGATDRTELEQLPARLSRVGGARRRRRAGLHGDVQHSRCATSRNAGPILSFPT